MNTENNSSDSLLLKKLVLGTVQLGLPYGINNVSGQPSREQAFSLLATAYRKGVRLLDTAEAYGNSQEIIGSFHRVAGDHCFAVITKYKAQKDLAKGADFRNHFLHNLRILTVPSLEAYLFHNFDDYCSFAHWEELEALQHQGLLRKIGVSLYTNEQANKVALDKRVNLVQLPYNLLDNFSLRSNSLTQLRESGKEVHIRSAFLQGLFYKNRGQLGRLEPLKKHLEQLDRLASENKLDIATLALAYCLRQPLIDKVLIGVETEVQLTKNLAMLETVKNVDGDIFQLVDQIHVSDTALLNPSNW